MRNEYRAEMYDGEVKVSSIAETTSMDYQEWKVKAISVLKPKCHLVRFFIKEDEQFFNDTKIKPCVK